VGVMGVLTPPHLCFQKSSKFQFEKSRKSSKLSDVTFFFVKFKLMFLTKASQGDSLVVIGDCGVHMVYFKQSLEPFFQPLNCN
jgi:hypothetical protein